MAAGAVSPRRALEIAPEPRRRKRSIPPASPDPPVPRATSWWAASFEQAFGLFKRPRPAEPRFSAEVDL